MFVEITFLFCFPRGPSPRLPYQIRMLRWVERPGLVDVACPVTHEKLKLAFIQMRMKDFTHIPQLPVKGSASKCPEGSASPFLKSATLQYLSRVSTSGNGFRIQALLLSSFVCK